MQIVVCERYRKTYILNKELPHSGRGVGHGVACGGQPDHQKPVEADPVQR